VLVQLGVVLETDGADLYGQIGTAGGIKSADNARHTNIASSSSASYSGAASASSSVLAFATNLGNVSGENLCQSVTMPNPSGQYKTISTTGAYIGDGAAAIMTNGSGSWLGGTDQLATYRVLPQSDTITSGTFLLYGISAP